MTVSRLAVLRLLFFPPLEPNQVVLAAVSSTYFYTLSVATLHSAPGHGRQNQQIVSVACLTVTHTVWEAIYLCFDHSLLVSLSRKKTLTRPMKGNGRRQCLASQCRSKPAAKRPLAWRKPGQTSWPLPTKKQSVQLQAIFSSIHETSHRLSVICLSSYEWSLCFFQPTIIRSHIVSHHNTCGTVRARRTVQAESARIKLFDR